MNKTQEQESVLSEEAIAREIAEAQEWNAKHHLGKLVTDEPSILP